MVGDLGKVCGLEQFWFCSLRKLDLVSLLDNLNRMRNLHNIREEVSLSGGCMTFHVGSSLCETGHLLWSDAPPPRSPLPTYPWSSFLLKTSTFTSTRLPGLSFCHSTIFVGMLLLLIGPVPPVGWSSIYPIWKLCIHPHAWQRPLSWGPHCCQWWERQSWPGA